jgi:hypothetical protein
MTFVAITIGGFVLFAFQARDTTEARETVKSLRKRSDTIVSVRKLRADDMGVSGAAIEHRGAGK